MENTVTELKANSLLTEKMDKIEKQVSRLENLIGISGVTENGQSTPMVSKFDIYANRLEDICERLIRCNTEVEKL